MNDKESIVAYPHEIKFIDKNGGSISYYVDRKVSDYVKELQDKLSKVESENRQKDIDKLQLQSNWNSLREFLEMIPNGYMDRRSFNDGVIRQEGMESLRKLLLDKMNELEGKDKE